MAILLITENLRFEEISHGLIQIREVQCRDSRPIYWVSRIGHLVCFLAVVDGVDAIEKLTEQRVI
jgi:hypothetical protein